MKQPMIWSHIERPEFGFANSWSQMIQDLENRHIEALPDLRSARDLIVTTDYAGYHKGAKYETISILLAALDGCTNWESKRVRVRRRFLPGGRRMSFKGLNDRHRRNALASFVDAANDIPGILVSFCTRWDLHIPLCADEVSDRSADPLVPEALFPAPAFRRLIRSSIFVSLFLAGLSAPMQNLLWISDEDDIVANQRRLCAATTLIGHVTSRFLPHGLGHLRFGSTKSDNGSRSIEDLAALPDLAAGALTEVFSLFPDATTLSSVLQEAPNTLSMKARRILSWLGDSSHKLKKLVCVLSPGDLPRTLKSEWIRIFTTPAMVQLPRDSSLVYQGSIFRETL